MKTNAVSGTLNKAQNDLASMKNKNIFQRMYCSFPGMQAAW